jgi:hypothetical protein
VARDNDTRPCRYSACTGTQRFTTIAALGGMPGWECSEGRAHVEREGSVDFSDEGRAGRIDVILSDLHFLEDQAARIRNRNDRELLDIQIRLVISRVQAERDHIKYPPRTAS